MDESIIEQKWKINSRLGEIGVKIRKYWQKDREHGEAMTIDEFHELGIISDEDVEFIKQNSITYNPPSTAATNANSHALWRYETGDGKPTVLLRRLVDIDRPDVTRVGTLNDLNNNILQFMESDSEKGRMLILPLQSVNSDEDNHGPSVSLINPTTEYELWFILKWNRDEEIADRIKHLARVHGLTKIREYKSPDQAEHLTKLNRLHGLEYKHNPAWGSGVWVIEFKMPRAKTKIVAICREFLKQGLNVGDDTTIRYTADGFRFRTE